MKAVRERDRDKERHRVRERESFSSAVMPIMSYLYQRGRVAHNSDNLNQQHWRGNCGKIDPSPPTTPAPYVVLFTSSRREEKKKQPTMECRLQFVVCLKSSWYFQQCNWCQVLVWKKKKGKYVCLDQRNSPKCMAARKKAVFEWKQWSWKTPLHSSQISWLPTYTTNIWT